MTKDDLSWAVVLVVAFLLGLLATFGFLATRDRIQRIDDHLEPKTHEPSGTTYVEGTCYVDDDGVLWCSERG
jgi:hypothetical protein